MQRVLTNRERETDEQPAGGVSLRKEAKELRWALHNMTVEALGVLL